MKAVLVEAPRQVTVTKLPDPVPDVAEAVLKVEACGICGTDLHLLEGDLAQARYPVVPGHEFCGEVVAIGPGVTNVRIGDFVAVDPNIYCGHCRFCRAGRNNLCENYRALGITCNGGSADLVSVPAFNAFSLPSSIPRRWGTLVEPLACAVHGFDQVGVRLGSSYLIYGAGTMGLLLGQLARHAGARSVDMVDTNASKFDVATRLAADRIATTADEFSPPPPAGEGKGGGKGAGWDVVIDATGVIAAIEDGLRRVTPGGTFLVFGVANSTSTARFSPFEVYRSEIRIIGSMAILNSFERAVELLVTGVIDGEAMLTHQFTLDDYPKAIDAFKRGLGLKIQVTP